MRTPKSIDPKEIDLVNQTIYGVLKQVKFSSSHIDPSNPPLVSVWCCELLPVASKIMVNVIRESLSTRDTYKLNHIKRFRSIRDSGTQETLLQCILCSVNSITTQAEIQELLYKQPGLKRPVKIFKIQVPLASPPTRQIAEKWSVDYWPISWKGNPNHQTLKSTHIDIERTRKTVLELIDLLKQNRSISFPVVTLLVKEGESTMESKSIGIDERSRNPLHHSVMVAINKVATQTFKQKNKAESHDREKENTGDYLCNGYTVYTTHEPCAMCCMALVHSRVSRIIYLKEAPHTGGLGSNYQLGDRDGLNWSFEIWKWIGGNETRKVDEINSNIYAFN